MRSVSYQRKVRDWFFQNFLFSHGLHAGKQYMRTGTFLRSQKVHIALYIVKLQPGAKSECERTNKYVF
jgi:hypothetical protein